MTDAPIPTPCPTQVQRFRGVLLGGACGDALGAPVEFMQRTEILGWFGAQGIRDYVAVDGRVGAITDDTQLTLFCAEAILRAHVEGAGTDAHTRERARSYLRWLLTQGETQPLLDTPASWLMGHADLFHRRGPGQTCLSSLRAMRTLGARADNTSKGCGGVMRIAPVGMFHSHFHASTSAFDAQVFDAGVADAALTHGHPCGHLPAGYLALLVALLLAAVPLDEALERSRRRLAAKPDHAPVTAVVDRALALARSDPFNPEQLASLGLGWCGDEALAMSLYCAAGSEFSGGTFEAAVALAVNHDGDSDSTGAITGSLLGALHGESVIPPRWLDPLELRTAMATLADDLAAAPHWSHDSDARLRYRSR